MKKIKNILFSVLLSSSFIAITSCSGGIGDANLAGSDLTNSALIVGWGKASVTESYFTDIGVLNNEYPLNILGCGYGTPYKSDITLTLSVDASSTAIDGDEYTIPSASFTIPAGSSFAMVPVNVNTGSFNATAATKVVINVVASSNGVVVSNAAKQMTINFVGCKSDIASFTYEVTTIGRGRQYGPHLETVTEESVNSFLTASVGYWDPTLNPGHGIRFSAICGVLTIPQQDLADTYSNEVGPLGTAVVEANGDFVLKYYISLSGVNEAMTATYIRQ